MLIYYNCIYKAQTQKQSFFTLLKNILNDEYSKIDGLMDLPFTKISQRVKRSDIYDEILSYYSSFYYLTKYKKSDLDESDPGNLKEFIVLDS